MGRPTKRGEYQYVSGVMGIAYNPFLDSQDGNACMNFKVAELLKFWTEKIVEIDPTKRERPSLGLLLEKMSEIISVPRSDKKVELRLGKRKRRVVYKFGDHLEVAETILVPTSPREPDRRSYGAGEIIASEG